VISQWPRNLWELVAGNHKTSLTGLSDEEFEALTEYLIANFNPDRPVPEVPESLMVPWPAYF